MSTGTPDPVTHDLPVSTSVAVLAARFNAHIVDVLLEGCVGRLKQIGVDESRIDVQRTPGAFELPVAAKLYALTKRYQAVICLGCVIRGETPHFEYVAGETARGIQAVALETGVPIIFGVLTVETEEQARARAGGTHGHAGVSAADAAGEMIQLIARIRK